MTAITEPHTAIGTDIDAAGGTPVPIPEIRFVRPLPGLDEARRFALVPIDEAGVLYSMQSLDAPGVRLVVAAPSAFFPQYEPEIDEQSVSELGLAAAEEALVLVVLTVPETLLSSTANLLAPIVIHRDTRDAVQVVLTSGDLALRAPLFA